jgi:hypothetical protein
VPKAVAESNALGGSPCASAGVSPAAAKDKTAAPKQLAFDHFVIRLLLAKSTCNLARTGLGASKV